MFIALLFGAVLTMPSQQMKDYLQTYPQKPLTQYLAIQDELVESSQRIRLEWHYLGFQAAVMANQFDKASELAQLLSSPQWSGVTPPSRFSMAGDLGVFFRRMGYLDLAEGALLCALERDYSLEHMLNLSVVYRHSQRTEEALYYLDKASFSPHTPKYQTYINLGYGRVYEELGLFNQAVLMFRAAYESLMDSSDNSLRKFKAGLNLLDALIHLEAWDQFEHYMPDIQLLSLDVDEDEYLGVFQWQKTVFEQARGKFVSALDKHALLEWAGRIKSEQFHLEVYAKALNVNLKNKGFRGRTPAPLQWRLFWYQMQSRWCTRSVII